MSSEHASGEPRPGDLVTLNDKLSLSSRRAYGVGIVTAVVSSSVVSSSDPFVTALQYMVMWSGPGALHMIMVEHKQDLQHIK